MLSNPHDKRPLPRYGCQEFREDSDRVIGERAGASVTDRYHEHMRACADCRRVDRIVRAAHLGPILPAIDERQRDREFAAIMARRDRSRGHKRMRQVLSAGGLIGLSAAAATLALSLFAPGVLRDVGVGVHDATPAAVAADATQVPALPSSGGQPESAFSDRSRTFGRVVAGDALLIDDEGRPISSENLAVGTSFSTDGDDPMQMALMGRILASIEAGSSGRWNQASSSMIEIGLDLGALAIRYDRRPTDPLLQIRTPTAIVRVVGTVFTVEVDEAGRTTVAVLRGEVEILDPTDEHLLAEVNAGFLYSVADASFGEIGRAQVAAALPLSNETRAEEPGAAADPPLAGGEIPASWVVPGLADEPTARIVEHVIDPGTVATAPPPGKSDARRRAHGPQSSDDGEDVLAELLTQLETERREELRRSLELCRELYASAETRFRAAKCLTRFMERYGDEPESVEGLLLIGILRMDFAHDYQAAEIHFEKFLRRAPNHERAELAMYKLVLASIEAGKVAQGRGRARDYLARYPEGRYVGLILQRLPELKSAI